MARYLSPSQWLRWSSSFPNGYVGRRAFPIEAEIRPAAIPVGQNTHTQRVTLTWLLVQAGFQHRGNLRGADPYTGDEHR